MSLLKIRLMVLVSVLVLASFAVASIASGSSPSVRTRSAALRTQTTSAQTRQLVERKLAEARAYARHHPRAGAWRHYTYPEQGVNVTAPGAAAQRMADTDGVPDAASILRRFRREPLPLAPSTSTPTASLKTVTEAFPVVSGVHAGTPYQAWVITSRGPEIMTGGPVPAGASGTTTASARTPTCQDVAIFDLSLSRWTERMQAC